MLDRLFNVKNYVAVIDIGSNAVRLIIYDGIHRAPFKVHTERSICNLGVDLPETGRLNEDSVKKALESLSRFAVLLKGMKVKNIEAVATAAIRDAEDGPDFIKKVRKETGIKVRVLSGEEEARLAALGVLIASPGANGVIGDYGGGSLELIIVENKEVKYKVSLPIGSHHLLSEQDSEARIKKIDEHLDSVRFLDKCVGRDFYAIGGAWRSMAMAHMHISQHPLSLLDHYQIKGNNSLEFAHLIANQTPAALRRSAGIPDARLKDIGVAALVMERLFERIKPYQLVFSGTNLREGILYDQLKPSVQKKDALIASCEKMAFKTSRYGDIKGFKMLSQWIDPLFEGEALRSLKWLEASCLLSDISCLEYDTDRSMQAFHRILTMPFYGIDHTGRAFLALSQYARYHGDFSIPHKQLQGMQDLLGEKMTNLAIRAGFAQAIAHRLTASTLGLLSNTELSMTSSHLVLTLKGKACGLKSDVILDLMTPLAEHLERRAVIKV